ncbi:hypothetical protein BH10BAC1_BH10BAC1_19070 [soil metagenome]
MVSLLKNKLFVFATIVLFVVLLVNCSNNTTSEEAKITDSTNCAKPLNPNGDSELALLMRNMMNSSKNLKEIITQGNIPKEFPESFKKIHTANPTDSDTKKESFDAFASSYISKLQNLYSSPKEDLKINYNAVVTACENCHSEHCPGPLNAINKLKITE